MPGRKKPRPLSMGQARECLAPLPGWRLVANAKSISKKFVMKDFSAAVAFIQSVLPVAEAQNHHPDFHLTGYRKLQIVISTHEVGGLTDDDFILAAKIEALPKAGARVAERMKGIPPHQAPALKTRRRPVVST